MLIFNYDPLAQYEFLIINFTTILFLFSNSFLIECLLNNIFFFNFLIYILLIIFFKIFFTSKPLLFINHFYTTHLKIYIFINDIVNKNITLPKKFITCIYVIIFLLILSDNLIGLIPFTYTLTSGFIITLTFSLIMFLFINIIAIYKISGVTFVGIFLPNGTPKGIIPLLVLIEIVSYISRVFSLAIRLFANMMAGHTLLKILIAFTFVMFCNLMSTAYAILP